MRPPGSKSLTNRALVTAALARGGVSRLIGPLGMKTTRLARGLPAGGDLEYADDDTLTRALEGRRELND